MRNSIDTIIVGDVFIDREYPKTAVHLVDEKFGEADLRIGNLEGPLSNIGEKVPFSASHLQMDPESVEALSCAGFDVLSLANNHAMDYGPDALMDSIRRLAEHDIAVVGAGANSDEAECPMTIERGDCRIGVVAFDATPESAPIVSRARSDSPGVNLVNTSPLYPAPHVEIPDLEKVKSSINETADAVDVLIALFHFGIGYTVTTPQEKLAKAAIDEGADVVVGTNAHILQRIELYEERPIFYGIGHFFWEPLTNYQSMIKELPRTSVLLELELTTAGVEEARFYPVFLNDSYQPEMHGRGTDVYDDVYDELVDLARTPEELLNQREDHFEISLP